jgi:hypothetical protein
MSKFNVSSYLLKFDENDNILRKVIWNPAFNSPYMRNDEKEELIKFVLFEEDNKKRIWFPDLKTRVEIKLDLNNQPIDNENLIKELRIVEYWFMCYRNFELCEEYTRDYQTTNEMVKRLLETKIPLNLVDKKGDFIAEIKRQQAEKGCNISNEELEESDEIKDYSKEEHNYKTYLQQMACVYYARGDEYPYTKLSESS